MRTKFSEFSAAFFWLCMAVAACTQARGEEEHIHGLNVPDWYESTCCSNQDCHPVADGVVQNKLNGVEVKGYGMLSYTDPRLRWSRDLRDHICEPADHSKLLCVYRRFNGT